MTASATVTSTPIAETTPLSGKVAVVTGSTSGIGRAVALALAARGATTVVVGRRNERAEAAANEISRATHNPNIFPIAVTDLALRSEAHRLVSVLRNEHPRIDVLVNNAGGYFHRREVTAEGLERTFALNVLAPFILTSGLADCLAAAAPARVVQVSSEAHRGHRVDFDDLQSSRGYRGFRTYGRSKLELTLLTREFARRLRGRGVSVNAVHPGFVASGFGRNNPGGVGIGFGILSKLFGRSVRRGADPVIFAASDASLASTTGAYLARHHVGRGSAASQDDRSARRLFDACAELAGAAA